MGSYYGGNPFPILERLSPGVHINVVFDHTGPHGLRATFLGSYCGTAKFLVDGEVLWIPVNKIQAISLGN